MINQLMMLSVLKNHPTTTKFYDAFTAGIAYHDAIMDLRKLHPENAGKVVESNAKLDELFTDWHNKIAIALGVPND